MHSLAARVLSHIRRQELLRAGDRVGVAVSGGIDSVALLRLLLEMSGELGIVLSVVHFNHKLRGADSDGDEKFVADLAREHDLEFFCDSDDVAEHAADEHISVEAAARELRYGFFRYLLGEDQGPQGLKPSSSTLPLRGPNGPLFHVTTNSVAKLVKIATGHTLDDQAETVLMHAVRGTGLRGLAAIHPRIAVEDLGERISGEIVRPLLGNRRRELDKYLLEIGQSWHEDSSNADESFTRNRVRKLLMPLLEKEFNPGVAENLAELAEIARGEEDYWENEVSGWIGTGVHWAEPEWARRGPDEDELVQIAGAGNVAKESGSPKFPTSRAKNAREMGHPAMQDLRSRIEDAPWLVMNASVDRLWFLGEPVAVQRRVVKAIGDQAGIRLEFKHLEEVLRFAAEDGPSGKALSLPLGWKVVREPEQLVFTTPDLREPRQPCNYEYDLPKQGKVVVREISVEFEAQRISADLASRHDADLPLDLLLDSEPLAFPLKLRNWRAGDRFWPAHTKASKKIKELLQERHVPQAERKLWPVAVSGDEIVWVRGFSVPAKFRAKPHHDAVMILEKLLDE
jgi:tRNA(Ile)-lysidine synthase